MTEKQKLAALFILTSLVLGLLFLSFWRYRWYRSYIEVSYREDNSHTSAVNVEDSLADKKIDINSADVYTLTTLPGVGRETALRIIQYRVENGRYRSVDGLMDVKGIGPKKLEKIKKYARIE